MKKIVRLVGVSMLVIMNLSLIKNVQAADIQDNSQATFHINASDDDSENGKLTLSQVPSFNFGEIKVSEIYKGFKKNAEETPSSIIVKDMRLGNNGWILSTSMEKFKKEDENTELEDASIRLKSSVAFDIDIVSDITHSEKPLVSSMGDNRGEFKFELSEQNTTLELKPNPQAIIQNEGEFKSIINWTLSGEHPEVPGL